MPEKTIRITVELSQRESEALAHMLKRMSLDDVLKFSSGHPEAHDALTAILKVQRALADQGFAPR